MSLAILGGAVLLLLLLIVRFKLNAFLSLILVSLAAGLLNGMAAEAALRAVLKGIGDTMGSIALILVFGAILGKMIEESGAARTITAALTRLFGERRLVLSIMITGFLVGLPMIYNASFLVLLPLVYTLSATTGIPLMRLGIPLSAALGVAHGYLPPHPAPTSIAVLYKADVNLTLLYGLVLAIPASILAGPVLARFFRHLKNAPPPEFYTHREIEATELPGVGTSLMAVLTPVLLMLAGAAVELSGVSGGAARAAKFVSDPTMALLLGVLFSLYSLGIRRGRDMESLMKSVGAAAASVSMVLLIIAAGGAFKQVLLESGTGDAIKQIAARIAASPLIVAWCAAALLRLALGSATVAAITAGGIVLPLVADSGVSPELLVLATTAGSLMFSHFNDIGFWMFREYYGVTVRQTFQIWTVMESIIAIVGLVGTLALGTVVHAAPRRAVYINSYHQGYPSSDAVMAGIRDKLKSANVRLDVFLLDAKRHPGDARAKAGEALAALRRIKPDIVLVSDDDAVAEIVVPHLRGGPTPVVFCGVNWDASQYGLPTPYVTGMLEVVPVEMALAEVRRQKPSVRRLAVLSEDSISERNNTRFLDPKYRALGFEPRYELVRRFADWKAAFARAQSEADVIYLPTNGAIEGWNPAEAVRWVSDHSKLPVVTCDDFMMPYAALGFTKVAREQGEWAAETALRILRGASPAAIPIASNRLSRCFVNPQLAARSGLRAPPGVACEARP